MASISASRLRRMAAASSASDSLRGTRAWKGSVGGMAVALLLAQVERMEQIISDFIRIASDKPAPRERLALAAPAQSAARHFQLNSDATRISLEVDVAADVEVMGNARLLEQLVLN